MKVILISGKARNGKDTVAEILEKKLKSDGKTVLTIHYSDILKFICSKYLGWDGKKDEAGRELLQHVGTDIIRAHDPDYLINFVTSVINFFDWDYVIIPDCRLPDEITKIQDKGFDTIHIRVTRDSASNKLSKHAQSHITETALDDYPADAYIANDGTIGELKQKVYELLDPLK